MQENNLVKYCLREACLINDTGPSTGPCGTPKFPFVCEDSTFPLTYPNLGSKILWSVILYQMLHWGLTGLQFKNFWNKEGWR